MPIKLLSGKRCGLTLVCFVLGLSSAGFVEPPLQAQTTKQPATAKKAPAAKKGQTPPAAPADTSNVKIAPVKPELREAALKSAARIDELVAAKLKQEGLKANAPATDEQFVRRIYLDVTGTIPRSRQAETFIRTTGATKRAALIDALLNSPGYGSQMYNWLADILRLVDQTDFYGYARPYSDWVKESLRENRHWDAMVREMLTTDGRIAEHPAAGYVLRDRGMPLDNLNNTVRIFLGTRIGCAQCHDHPFDRWTQQEFYQLAAFVGGLEYNLPKDKQTPLQPKDTDALAFTPDAPDARVARQMLLASRRAVTDNEKKMLRFPPTFNQEAMRNKLVTPAVIFGKPAPATIAPAERRKVFAEWITSPENPRFALTMANRLWRKAMGVGLIEPPDDMKDETVASNPELMAFLASELIRLQFDMKEFQRIIYNTKTYQARVTYEELDTTKPYHFAGPVLRRMTAEQVWDSLLTLTVENPDAQLRPEDDTYLAAFVVQTSMSANDVIAAAQRVQDIRKDDAEQKKKRLYKGNELLRASELPQPVPEGHFLRQFGQSDRTAIADSRTDGTVPQLLTMFNGPVTHMMLEDGSVIYNEVTSGNTPAEQIERIFLCILSRRPTSGEKTTANREMNEAGAAGYGNVIWALLNTREFLFIQ